MKRISKRVFSFIMAMAIVVGMIMAVPMNKVNAATQSNPGQKLVMNTLYKGTLDERGLGLGSDNYYGYDFTLTKSGALLINTEVSGLSAIGFMRYSIYDSDGNRVWHKDVSNGIIDIGADLLAGDYFLKAEQPTPGLENYFKFSAKFVDANETFPESVNKRNDTMSTANPYTIAKAVNGQIAQNDKNDYYSFKIQKNSFVTYSVNSDSVMHALYIYDKKGNVILYESLIANDNNKINFFLPKGKYYMNIAQNGGAGNYTFKLTTKNMPTGKITKIKKKWYSNGSSLEIRLSKVNNSDGYEVAVSRKKNFKGAKKQMVSIDSRKAFIFDLKHKTTYYAKVRTYYTDKKTGKKYFSAWSKVKKVKTK